MKVHTIEDFTFYTKDFKTKKGFKALLKKVDPQLTATHVTCFALGLVVATAVFSKLILPYWNH